MQKHFLFLATVLLPHPLFDCSDWVCVLGFFFLHVGECAYVPIIVLVCACVCAGEGQVCVQDPPARNSGAAEEVQRQEEAEGQHHLDAKVKHSRSSMIKSDRRGSVTSSTACICI